jgi:branched-chain amino acid transport system substrate-binding protein
MRLRSAQDAPIKTIDTFNQSKEIKMPTVHLRLAALSAAVVIAAATSNAALAQKKYDTGATDTEIKIGNIMPYSGPASSYSVIGKTEAAYFNKINAEGGINGRKINFISYDDGYSPPKTVEQARKLVESDEVLFIFNSLGTPPNSAIHKYMNEKKVPQLFVAPAPPSGTTRRISPGPWAFSPTIKAKPGSTRDISSRTCLTPRSPCSTRTTITARTI